MCAFRLNCYSSVISEALTNKFLNAEDTEFAQRAAEKGLITLFSLVLYVFFLCALCVKSNYMEATIDKLGRRGLIHNHLPENLVLF